MWLYMLSSFRMVVLLLLQLPILMMLRDAAAGCCYLHDRNVMHGDLNVSINFGIAFLWRAVQLMNQY